MGSSFDHRGRSNWLRLMTALVRYRIRLVAELNHRVRGFDAGRQERRQEHERAFGRLAAALREHEAEIVALLASRESAAPAAGPSQETVPQAVPPDTSAIDRAAEYHQRRIAAKEADLALRGLGPDGVTPLAEYQRLAAEGAKTAKAALAAGHESLSKITNTPSPTNGQWAEPKITGNPPLVEGARLFGKHPSRADALG
jgi:hypothetical protein